MSKMDDRLASSSPEAAQWREMAEGLDQYREFLRVCIAAVEAEGFTPREARALVTSLITGNKDTTEGEK